MSDREEARFWDWFVANEADFRALPPSRKEVLLSELLSALQCYDRRLFFQVGGSPDGPRELIISAEGEKSAFPAVNKLVASAPKVDGWRFIALKPGTGFDFVTRYEDVQIDPAQCWFQPVKSDNGDFGIDVAIPDYPEARARQFENALWIALQTGLGELVLATEVTFVRVERVPPAFDGHGYMPLTQLPGFLRWRRSPAEDGHA